MLQLKLNNLTVKLVESRFPDSAAGIKLEGTIPRQVEHARIDATFTKGESLNDMFFKIALLVDIVRSINSRSQILLFMPYIPYARQDRRMVRHDGFSMKVFANLLNSLKLDSVMVFDSHSDVATALIDNVVHVTQEQIIDTNPINHGLSTNYDVIVAPDAGALKKIHKVAKALKKPVVVLDKERNVQTGEITGTKLLSPISDVEGKCCLIVDDICDGGATFIAAAAELKQAGAENVSLWVTHGIFSRGVEHLLDNGILNIHTTDSYYGDDGSSRVSVYRCAGIEAMRFRGI